MLETLTDTIYTGDEGRVSLDTKTKGAITREWKKRGVVCLETKEEHADDGSDEEEDIEML
jgi:hypothetical protein